jgi:carbon storage regulator
MTDAVTEGTNRVVISGVVAGEVIKRIAFTEETSMLVLSRKVGQELIIGDNIRIVVSRVAGNRVSLAIQAPDNVHVIRAELQDIRDQFAEAEEEAPRPRTSLKRLGSGSNSSLETLASLRIEDEFASPHLAAHTVQ